MTMADNKDKKVLNVPGLRFPEFTEEWKEERLGKIAELSKGVGISKEQLSEDGEPCILYGELYTKYKSEIIHKVISKTNIESSNLKRSKRNDVIIPCSGETAIDIAVARCVPFDNILLGGDLNIIRLHKDDGAFMAYQLNGKRKIDIAQLACTAGKLYTPDNEKQRYVCQRTDDEARQRAQPAVYHMHSDYGNDCHFADRSGSNSGIVWADVTCAADR